MLGCCRKHTSATVVLPQTKHTTSGLVHPTASTIEIHFLWESANVVRPTCCLYLEDMNGCEENVTSMLRIKSALAFFAVARLAVPKAVELIVFPQRKIDAATA